MSTRPSHATVEADQIDKYVLLTIASVGPGEMPGTTRIVTAEYPDFHTDVAGPIEVFAPLSRATYGETPDA